MYDVIIIGGGAGGLGCALYASRYNMKVALFTDIVGGVVTKSQEVENYPGTLKATGFEIMQKWEEQVKLFGTEIKNEWVKEIKKESDGTFTAVTDKETYQAKTILLATGAKERKLNVPGEEEFESKGVSSCATCDGMFFKDKIVAVIGGGDSAIRGAQVLLQYCPKVYVIHRRKEFRAEPMNMDAVKNHENVEFKLERTLKEIKGDERVTSIILDNDEELQVQGVFVEVGSIPNIEFATKFGCEIDEKLGLIKVKPDQSTNVEGVYAAGDVTTASNNFRQLVTAAAEGAVAAESIFNYVKQVK